MRKEGVNEEQAEGSRIHIQNRQLLSSFNRASFWITLKYGFVGENFLSNFLVDGIPSLSAVQNLTSHLGAS